MTDHDDEYAQYAPLFDEFAAATDEAERERLRTELITGHLPLAEHIARRFSNRGQPAEDLRQVASLGLIQAVSRFDPARGTDFLSFAVPTIMGEIRRYFRDNGWSVHVPRRLQELHLRIGAATTTLFQELSRSPTPSELAAYLQVSVDEVYEGLEAGNAYSVASMDQTIGEDGDAAGQLARKLGYDDPELEKVTDVESLKPLIGKLPERERLILSLRFHGNMTQTQIADRMGMSQMHVSRLLARTLAELRSGLTET